MDRSEAAKRETLARLADLGTDDAAAAAQGMLAGAVAFCKALRQSQNASISQSFFHLLVNDAWEDGAPVEVSKIRKEH
jgi:hypothetical protein